MLQLEGDSNSFIISLILSVSFRDGQTARGRASPSVGNYLVDVKSFEQLALPTIKVTSDRSTLTGVLNCSWEWVGTRMYTVRYFESEPLFFLCGFSWASSPPLFYYHYTVL